MADLVTLSSTRLSSSMSASSNLWRPAAVTSGQKRLRRRADSEFSSVSLTTRLATFKVQAALTEAEQPNWWEKNGSPNMIDIHSKQELLNAFTLAGDRLVIIEFYGSWCGACRALHPKLCKTAQEHGDIMFVKVNFDENKDMCKALNIRVLPYFHFYRGDDGQLEAFSCSLSKFQKIRDAINRHNTARSSLGPARQIQDLSLESTSHI